MSNWKKYKLSDLGDIKTGKTPPSSCENAFSLKGIPFITPKDMKGQKWISETERYLSKEGLKTVANYLVPKNSIAVSCIGSDMGKAVLLSDNSVTNQQINSLIVNKNHNFEFIYYKLSTMQEFFKSIASGSATPILNKSHFSNIEIDLPCLEYQNQYVEYLKYLDKKIQLNTQINQTLEQIAQAVFKSWFIDFDPVRAKVAAKAQGATDDQAEQAAVSVISGKSPTELTAYRETHPEDYQKLAQLARHFPSEFDVIDGVEVPKGWGIKLLPEIIDFLEGPGIRNWQYTDNEDGINFINIRCIQSGDLLLSSANKITKEEAFGKYAHFQLQENDIVISTSGTLGRSAIVRKEHLPLCLNTSVIRFRPIDNQSTFSFIYGFVNNQLQYELETRASGSVQKNFGPTHLKGISVLVPNFELLELHQEYLNHLFEKRKSNLVEIDLLSKIRDLLLPKLLNGELKNE